MSIHSAIYEQIQITLYCILGIENTELHPQFCFQSLSIIFYFRCSFPNRLNSTSVNVLFTVPREDFITFNLFVIVLSVVFIHGSKEYLAQFSCS